jgi:hypothetical protein
MRLEQAHVLVSLLNINNGGFSKEAEKNELARFLIIAVALTYPMRFFSYIFFIILVVTYLMYCQFFLLCKM